MSQRRIPRGGALRDAQLCLRLTLGLVLAGLGSASCRDHPFANAGPPPSHTPDAREPQPSDVALPPALPAPTLTHTAAFELVATSEGAALVWAEGACSQGVQLQRFDPEGRAIGSARRLPACADDQASGQISDLAAAVGGGRLGLAWIVRGADTAAVRGTFGPDTGLSFAPGAQLGAADTQPGVARGQLWLAGAEDERLRVAFRGPEAPCTAERGSCTPIVSLQLPAPSGVPARHTDTREVPSACPRLLVGSLWSQGIWYDAFCAREAPEGSFVTELYAIRPEIFYAEASPLLRDCAPSGIAPSEKGVLVFGSCAGGTRVHALAAGQHTVLDQITRTVACEAGRPTLTLRAADGTEEVYKLTGPRDRLEMWLPADTAAPDSRAVFTGRRLLVAHVQQNRLSVLRYRCEGQSVVSDAAAML